ncbi:MAG: DUF3015 family protein [Thermodesulfobacteriota bacterium]
MKKLFSVMMILLLTAGVSFAVPPSNCGCGLGSMVFQDQNGLISQVSAVTTNALFGNQTFGITSGTLGCDRPGTLMHNQAANRFVAENMDNLAIDIATGQGESLQTLAEIIQMPIVKRPIFFATLQTNFDNIYPNPQVTHDFVIQQIARILERI